MRWRNVIISKEWMKIDSWDILQQTLKTDGRISTDPRFSQRTAQPTILRTTTLIFQQINSKQKCVFKLEQYPTLNVCLQHSIYLNIYCNEINTNIATQFDTEKLLTFYFWKVFNMAAPGYAPDIRAILWFVTQFVQESDVNSPVTKFCRV
jgi:hypothetical protein